MRFSFTRSELLKHAKQIIHAEFDEERWEERERKRERASQSLFVQTLIHGLLGLRLPFTNLCLPFFSAQLGGNKQPRSPTLDHTLLSNSTLVGGRVERRRDRIEIREEGIKAFISLITDPWPTPLHFSWPP